MSFATLGLVSQRKDFRTGLEKVACLPVYYFYLVIFGMLGALSRYGLAALMNGGHFPIATLMTNLLGCFLLAFMIQYIARVSALPSKFTSAIGTGFLGSFTTFSTFALEASTFIQSSEYILAGTYIFASLFGGLLASALGYRVSVALLIRRKRRYRHAD